MTEYVKTTGGMKHRQLLKCAGLGAAAIAFPMVLTPRKAGAVVKLTVRDPGGPYVQAYAEAYYKPFNKKFAGKIEVTGVGPVVALAGADVTVREGEFLTLLGPSGSGQSTMLMLIAGLIQPDSGEMWIDGKLSTYMPPHKRNLAMVFRNYALFPHMTVYDNTAFPLRMRRVSAAKIREEVRRVLDIVQLPGVEERLPCQLSSGQQQRIALARCMAYRPPIILMDEPMGALDKKLREQLQFENRHLHQSLDITVLYVTHDQEEALVMSDHICLMNEGEIEQLGTPDDLYFRPETLLAADFLGESNLFAATVSSRYNGTVKLRGPADVTIAAHPRGDVSEGQHIKVMVRPENVRLLAPPEEADNTLSARLQDVILSGQVTKYYAKLSDGTDVSATQLTKNGIPKFQPGEEVHFGFDLESAVVLPSDTHTERL